MEEFKQQLRELVIYALPIECREDDDIVESYFQSFLGAFEEFERYKLDDVIEAVQYGFDYRENSMNDGKHVPLGNTLQWLMHRKGLKEVPEEFEEKLKNRKY